MIYLALLFVLTGLLIMLLSIFSESGRTVRAASGKLPGSAVSRGSSSHSDPENIEIPLPSDPVSGMMPDLEEDIFIDFSDDLPSPSKPALTDDAVPEFENYHDDTAFAEDAYPAYPVNTGSTGVMAVLFDDRSNMIDYGSGCAVIDPAVTGYKSIKRVGAGRLEAEKDGLSFYLGDSLYRFDFHKIFDVWSGSNYIALPLKGSTAVKLFLLEDPAGFPDKVELFFQEYTKG